VEILMIAGGTGPSLDWATFAYLVRPQLFGVTG